MLTLLGGTKSIISGCITGINILYLELLINVCAWILDINKVSNISLPLKLNLSPIVDVIIYFVIWLNCWESRKPSAKKSTIESKVPISICISDPKLLLICPINVSLKKSYTLKVVGVSLNDISIISRITSLNKSFAVISLATFPLLILRISRVYNFIRLSIPVNKLASYLGAGYRVSKNSLVIFTKLLFSLVSIPNNSLLSIMQA